MIYFYGLEIDFEIQAGPHYILVCCLICQFPGKSHILLVQYYFISVFSIEPSPEITEPATQATQEVPSGKLK